MVCICLAAFAFAAQAKNTWSVFSAGLALPMASAAHTPSGDKVLKPGYDGGWTIFGLPFTKSESVLSGLGFGGKINYSRWKRDSTWNETYFLGTQGIVRYYLPFKPNRFEFFGQVGGGMFIGEHAFSDPDTLDRINFPPSILVTEGAKNFGLTLNLGVNWDVFEVTPGMTVIFTKGNSSAWLSLSAAAKF